MEKQKIIPSGTPNLEEAIPILEKWFDDIHANKEKEKEISKTQETQDSTSQVSQTSTTSPSQATTPTMQTSCGTSCTYNNRNTKTCCKSG